MGRTYFNHGITGNGKLLVTLTDKGELNRIFWPSPDYYQQINNIHAGIRINGSDTKFFHENIWYIEQSYEPRTNILKTIYENSDLGVRISQKDFVLEDKDVLVRNYTIKNISNDKLNIEFMLHTDFVSDNINIRNSFIDFENSCLNIYNKETSIVVGADKNIDAFQLGNNAGDAVYNGGLYGKEDISMTSDAGLKWCLGETEKEGISEINLFFTFSNNTLKSTELFNATKKIPSNTLLNNTKNYWNEVFASLKDVKTGNDKIDEIYNRALLTFKLFTNKDTGAIIAGAEVDENFSRCGRYGYCWPRDGVFITKAFDICGMTKEAENFYKVWATKTQLKNGAWQQRYFLDGTLAPSWGVQVDETASIVYGIWEHYKYTKNVEFLEEIWECVKNAAQFLCSYIDEETGLPKASYDIWEERLGKHTYSAASVVGALRAAALMAQELHIDTPLDKVWLEKADSIKEKIEKLLWDDNEKRFLRGIHTRLNWWNCPTVEIEVNPLHYKVPVAEVDKTVDISLLGLAVPFGVLDVKDERIKKTVRAIEERLDGFPSGGYGRYEYDSYIGGNPWIISTLWLALYYIEAGDLEKGRDLFMWAVKNATNLGFLPEQVDKFTGKPAWIMQLAWSAAMFIIVLDKMKKK